MVCRAELAGEWESMDFEVNSMEAIGAAWDRRVEAYEEAVGDIGGRGMAVAIELAAFRKALGGKAGLEIMDAGCGVGVHGRRLLVDGHRVTFVDVSPGMLRRARELAGETSKAAFEEADIRDLKGIGDGSFDAVISGGTVISDCGEPYSGLSELARALRKGGVIGFSVRNVDGPQQKGRRRQVIREGGDGFDWWFFSEESVGRLCERCGLRVEQVYPVLIEPMAEGDVEACVRCHLERKGVDEWRGRAWEMFVIAEKAG